MAHFDGFVTPFETFKIVYGKDDDDAKVGMINDREVGRFKVSLLRQIKIISKVKGNRFKCIEYVNLKARTHVNHQYYMSASYTIQLIDCRGTNLIGFHIEKIVNFSPLSRENEHIQEATSDSRST